MIPTGPSGFTISWVSTQGRRKEIKKVYWGKEREFHPDRHFACQSEELKGKLNHIVAHINLAYMTLSDLARRRRNDKPASGKPVKAATNTEIAFELFNEGKSKMTTGNAGEAEKLFLESIYYDNCVAEYHFYHGLALSLLKRFEESVRAINRALEIDPLQLKYFAELGHVFLHLGLSLRAKSSFDKALKISPSDKRALEGRRVLSRA